VYRLCRQYNRPLFFISRRKLNFMIDTAWYSDL